LVQALVSVRYWHSTLATRGAKVGAVNGTLLAAPVAMVRLPSL